MDIASDVTQNQGLSVGTTVVTSELTGLLPIKEGEGQLLRGMLAAAV